MRTRGAGLSTVLPHKRLLVVGARGLVGQGGDLQSVAQAGVLIHAACGDAAAASGERGLLAGDLMAHIRKWVNLH